MLTIKKNRLEIILRARQNMDIEEEEKDKLEKEMQVTKQTVLEKRKELYYELKEKERILYKRKRKGKRLYYEQKEKGKIQSTKQEVPKKVVLKQKVPEKVVLKQEVPKKGKELYYELKKNPEKMKKYVADRDAKFPLTRTFLSGNDMLVEKKIKS